MQFVAEPGACVYIVQQPHRGAKGSETDMLYITSEASGGGGALLQAAAQAEQGTPEDCRSSLRLMTKPGNRISESVMFQLAEQAYHRDTIDI